MAMESRWSKLRDWFARSMPKAMRKVIEDRTQEDRNQKTEATSPKPKYFLRAANSRRNCSDEPYVIQESDLDQTIELLEEKKRKREQFQRYLEERQKERKNYQPTTSPMYDSVVGGNGDNDYESSQVPSEILCRGPSAIKAYNKALLDGKACIKRLPLMIIGQDRTGKTSLKKSLKGEPFSKNESSTEGIERDPSHFKVSTEIWKTGEKGQEADSESKFLFDEQAAKLTIRNLKEEQTNSSFRLSEGPSTSNTQLSDSLDLDSCTGSDSDLSSEFKEAETVENLLTPELPEDIATLIESLVQNDKAVEEEDDIYSILWDFGGQSVYYATHPIFLTEKAIYILTYDLSRNPCEKSNVPVRKGMFKNNQDIHCTKTNMDYLHFWMASIYSLVCPDANCQSTAVINTSSTALPLVFFVCTHADEPYCGTDSRELALEIYGFLQTKIYSNLLFRDVFVVDNTKSGSEQECPEVVRLRKELLAFSTKLPQIKEAIPLKWLMYENVLCLLRNEGKKWISIMEARQIASDECGILDDKQFQTLLNFLHDQRILIHFNETPDLQNVVVLDPQWLIDVFKKVITVKRYEHVEEAVVELWRKLEKTGILDERLLDHAWGPLFDNQETRRSLIAIMERFSLLCSWPSADANKQYLVPSMLMYPPTDDVLEVLASVQLPSLFVKFELGRVPPGLFPRLVLQFFQWCNEEWKSPVNPELFDNFALFHILPEQGTSVILLCHSAVIEVVVQNGNDSPQEAAVADFTLDNFDVSTSRAIYRQLRLILECMRKEFSWLKNMRFEMCVCCPVCSQKGSAKCRAHDVRGCECLHLLSEAELQKRQYCTRPGVRGDCRIRVKTFAAWFADLKERRISLNQEQGATGRGVNDRSSIAFKQGEGKTLALPEGVVKSIKSQSCDPEGVVVQLQENLQLNPSAMDNPEPETKLWIRCLANAAKSENREDVVQHLRTITPAGTTGPLLDEDLDVRCIPFKQRKELTFSLCGGDEWKLLAEKLGMSYNEIRFLDKRTTNPCDVVLELMAKHHYLSVGEVYDQLVESGLAGSADLL